MVRYIIKVGELLCDLVYLITFAIIKQFYNSYEKGEKTISRLNIVILTKVQLKSINDVYIPALENQISLGVMKLGWVLFMFLMLHKMK